MSKQENTPKKQKMISHGVLLIDKPSGITSHDVVSKIRRKFSQKAVGHAGTLDPLASGLLILLLGEATKLSDYLLNNDKGYDVDVLFGIETDTLDITGETLKETVVDVNPEHANQMALSLSGALMLDVPKYSAVKKDGKKLYDYARKNQEVEIPKREMTFYDIHPLGVESRIARYSLKCLKGGYIRAWTAELGKKMECGATMQRLRRTLSAPYGLQQALALDEILEKDVSREELESSLGDAFVPMAKTLPDWPSVTVRGKDERLLKNGQISIDLGKRLMWFQKEALRNQKTQGIRVVSGERGQLLAILEAYADKPLKIKRVFNLK